MVYGYARVSTVGQDRYGTSLTDQTDVLKAAGATQVFADSYTGTQMHRPEFDKLMALLQPGDTVVVTKLDRLGRTAAGVIDLIRALIDRDITVRIMNMGTVENTPVGRLIITFLSGIAEFERDLIVERTAAGKAYKRANDPDYREGRKPVEFDSELFEALRCRVVSGEMSVADAHKALGVGKTTWYKICKDKTA